jgi:hypothetical protein
VTKAEAKQIELLRAAGPQARSGIAFALTDSVFTLSRGAMARAWPHLDDMEQKLKFIEVVYGARLAARVAEYLRKR